VFAKYEQAKAPAQVFQDDMYAPDVKHTHGLVVPFAWNW